LIKESTLKLSMMPTGWPYWANLGLIGDYLLRDGFFICSMGTIMSVLSWTNMGLDTFWDTFILQTHPVTLTVNQYFLHLLCLYKTDFKVSFPSQQ
jgi:hypothetical protein